MLLRQWSGQDDAIVADAMRMTDVLHLADRLVDEPSGGQRQRVWLAMVLAVDADLVEHVFGIPCEVIADPQTGTPLIVPTARDRRRNTTAPEPLRARP